MSTNSKLKNPITVIRTPEKINQEYSDIILKLGGLALEWSNIEKAYNAQEKRKENIGHEKEKMLSRIDELSLEMDESQKEIQRKKEQEKLAEPELPLTVSPSTDISPETIQ